MSAVDEHALLLSMMSLNTAIQKRLNGRLSVHGLAWSEYRVLQELAAAPDQILRRIGLAERVGLTASGVTRLLNPMEKIGLVEKLASDRDARVSLVSLSAAGQRLLAESAVTVADLADQIFATLTTTQQRDLGDALATVRGAV